MIDTIRAFDQYYFWTFRPGRMRSLSSMKASQQIAIEE